MTFAPALNIAAGITLGAAITRALGLRGLGATVEQCEEWRRAAAGFTAGLTDEERRQAAAQWNAQCRETEAATYAGAQAAIDAGQGNAEAQPRQTTRRPPRPTPEDYPAYVVPAPVCGPLDGACLECSRRVLAYNTAAIKNARRAFRRALCEWNNQQNRATGHPELARDCRALYPPVPQPPAPACGGAPVRAYYSGGDVQIPNAEWVAARPELFRAEPADAPAGPSPTMTQSAAETPAPDQAPESQTGGGSGGDYWPEVDIPAGVRETVERLPLPESLRSRPGLVLGILAAGAGLLLMGGGSQ